MSRSPGSSSPARIFSTTRSRPAASSRGSPRSRQGAPASSRIRAERAEQVHGRLGVAGDVSRGEPEVRRGHERPVAGRSARLGSPRARRSATSVASSPRSGAANVVVGSSDAPPATNRKPDTRREPPLVSATDRSGSAHGTLTTHTRGGSSLLARGGAQDDSGVVVDSGPGTGRARIRSTAPATAASNPSRPGGGACADGVGRVLGTLSLGAGGAGRGRAGRNG